MLHRACRDAVDWPVTAAGQQPKLRVYVSARQFDDSGPIDDIAAALDASGPAPARLRLEITENTSMGNIDCASQVVRALKSAASLIYLRQFLTDVIKLDRLFVRRDCPATQSICRSSPQWSVRPLHSGSK